jgi:hypothetical protein
MSRYIHVKTYISGRREYDGSQILWFRTIIVNPYIYGKEKRYLVVVWSLLEYVY